MQRFLLYLIIVLHIIFSTQSIAQTTASFVRFDLPSFVSVNNNFSTSLIFRLDEISDEVVIIKFTKPNSVAISSAVLNGNLPVPILKDSDSKNSLHLKLDVSEFSLEPNVTYQILLKCFTPLPTRIEKNHFAYNNDLLNKKEESNFINSQDIGLLETQIYESQKIAGKSLFFKKNSNLQFDIDEKEWENIYLDFWAKAEFQLEDFFSIEKVTTKEKIASISMNDFGFIAFPINKNELERKDYYLGNKNWNHVAVLLSNSLSGLKTSFYINSEFVYSIQNDNNFDVEKLSVKFVNTHPNKNFEIDRLKIFNYENNLNLALKNKHFMTFEADSSRLIFQSNFDNTGEFNSKYNSSNLNVINENLDYRKSDAPLFSRAPKLTVNIGSTYNSIVWYVQENKVANEFEIERAYGDAIFESVFSVLADDDPLKIYYFTDELVSESDIAYYRVKQINYDKSEVYSAEVKIGHKEIQEFNLSQNYPNPFNPRTNIYVDVVIGTEINVNVYDLVGNTVSILHDGFLAEGMHTFEFDGSSLPSGIYFYEVISPKSQSVKKMILAK